MVLAGRLGIVPGDNHLVGTECLDVVHLPVTVGDGSHVGAQGFGEENTKVAETAYIKISKGTRNVPVDLPIPTIPTSLAVVPAPY